MPGLLLANSIVVGLVLIVAAVFWATRWSRNFNMTRKSRVRHLRFVSGCLLEYLCFAAVLAVGGVWSAVYWATTPAGFAHHIKVGGFGPVVAALVLGGCAGVIAQEAICRLTAVDDDEEIL